MSKFIKNEATKSRLAKNNQAENENEGAEDNEEQKEEQKEEGIPSSDYDYLLRMPLWSLSQEKIDELNR